MSSSLHSVLVPSIFAALLFTVPVQVLAQTTAAPIRVTQPVNETSLVRLQGNTHPLARPEFDRGAVSPNFPSDRMLLVLRRSKEQEAALESLLNDQQDKLSPRYHRWLTPAQFGQQFGPADQDIQTVTSWLASFGFQAIRVGQGRTVIEFSGTAAQVTAAFHTEIHEFAVGGIQRWANVNDPMIPAALLPVVTGIDSLNSFPKEPNHRLQGVFSRSRDTGEIIPLAAADFTYPGSQCHIAGNCYAVGPYDFATIYNVLPLWNSSPAINGTAQNIGILAESNINVQDVRDFRNLFGLSANDPVIILNGPDPGLVSDSETEAVLDTEWSGAIATGATINLVVSASTNTTSGVDLSATFAVDNNVAPVVSESFGECELFLGTAGNAFQNSIRKQAAAQGITFINSAGDEGSARCDPVNGPPPQPAKHGLAVSGLASTPYGVAVGGTDFINFGSNFTPGASPYWSTTNNTRQASVNGYVPESAWNSTCANSVFITLGYGATAEAACSNPSALNWVETIAGGGGKSSCISSDGTDRTTCSGGYPKPIWQTGPTIPADGVRSIPDISFFSSSGFMDSFYLFCEADQIPSGTSCSLGSPYTNFLAGGGTSFAAPAFAGIMALVNQFTQSSGQGNANFVLYNLAASPALPASECPSGAAPAACIFNDVTSGTNSVPCFESFPDCTRQNNNDIYAVLPGYPATIGWDYATGWGSVNAYNLVHGWNSATLTPSVTSLNLNPVNITHGDPVSVSITVAGKPPTTNTPTGNVYLTVAGAGPDAFQDFTLDSTGSVSSANSTTLIPGGSNSIIAHYPGDGIFSGSNSAPVAVNVKPEPSLTAITAFTTDITHTIVPFTTATYGSVQYFRVAVSTARTGTNVVDSAPTGTVTISDTFNGMTTVIAGPVPLDKTGSANVSLLPANQPVPGTHSITASYSGDVSFQPSESATPLALSITQESLLEFIGFSPTAPVDLGTPVTITVVFQADNFDAGIPPTGMLTLTTGGVQLGPPAPLIGSYSNTGSPIATATLTTSAFSLGTNVLTQTYSGDANYFASQVIGNSYLISAPSVLQLSSSTLTVTQGAPVTLTATLSSPLVGGAQITGTVQFSISNGIAGNLYNVSLANNQAQLLTNTAPNLLPTGTATVTASFAGDGNYDKSSSSLQISVSPGLGNDFSLTMSAPSVTILSLGFTSSPLQVTVVPANGFSQFVTFSCSIAPAGSSGTCNFSQPSAGPGVSTNVTVSTVAPALSANLPRRRQTPPRSWPLFLASLIAFGCLIGFDRKHRLLRTMTALLFLTCILGVFACGGGGSGGGSTGGSGSTAPPGPASYTVTITGTSGSLQHTTSFTLNVNSN